MAVTSDAKVQEVHPGVYLIPLPLPIRPLIVNVYLIHSRGEWALVDTGMRSDASLAAFRAALETIGCEPRDITKILCSHHHPDHFGAAKPLKELTGANVYLHPAEYERSHIISIKEHLQAFDDYYRSLGIPVDRLGPIPAPGEVWSSVYAPVEPDEPLGDGAVIPVGDRELEVIWTPGHAPGHCVFHVRGDRLLVSGDHLLPKITPHVGGIRAGTGDPLGDFLDSQRKIQRFDVDLVLPAHGGVFRGHRHRANQIIQHHAARLQEIYDVVLRRPRLPYDAARRAFDFDIDTSIMVQFPATFETVAHLEHMRHKGLVVCEEREGQFWYSVAGEKTTVT